MNIGSIIIQNARVVLPDKVTPPISIRIEKGLIAEIEAVCASSDCRPLDAEGGYVFPGFIDVHVHGGGGADFMDCTPKAFETAVKAHLKHGTTTLVPTALTAKRDELLSFVRAYQTFKGHSDYASLAQGIHFEGPYFSKSNLLSKGAQDASAIRDIDFDEVMQLIDLAKGDIVRWDAAPEVPNSERFAQVMGEHGIICAVAHTDATADETQKAYRAGFSHVTHFYNAVTAYKKRDQVVTAGVVEATYLDTAVTVELICDGKHIPKQCLQLALQIKGPDRVLGITDAMRLSCTDDRHGKLGNLKNGTDVIVDDGVAKLQDMSSFAGSICTMDRALKVLCVDYGIDVVTAAKMLSTNPARHLHIDCEKGSVEVGKIADLVITDSTFALKAVIKDGILVV